MLNSKKQKQITKTYIQLHPLDIVDWNTFAVAVHAYNTKKKMLFAAPVPTVALV